MSALHPIELFSRWVPLTLGDAVAKAGVYRAPPKDSPAYRNAVQNGGNPTPLLGAVSGIISSESRDQQDEIIVQEGMEWDYFLARGHINYEHLGGPDNVIGYPESVHKALIQGVPATGFKGQLYLHDERARKAYDTALVMQKSGGARTLGFSVEGSVVRRDPLDRRRILKSRVLNVALTAHPVHPDAKLEILARSLQVAEALRKAGEIGYQSPASVQPGTIAGLVTQSLERGVSSSTYGGSTGKSAYQLQSVKQSIRKVFPAVGEEEADKVARALLAML